jgi:hypothetical protein
MRLGRMAPAGRRNVRTYSIGTCGLMSREEMATWGRAGMVGDLMLRVAGRSGPVFDTSHCLLVGSEGGQRRWSIERGVMGPLTGGAVRAEVEYTIPLLTANNQAVAHGLQCLPLTADQGRAADICLSCRFPARLYIVCQLADALILHYITRLRATDEGCR